jgi:hypothetical protein
MHPIAMALMSKGLPLLANAFLAKGKDWFKEKTGVDVDKANLGDADYVKLREFEFRHEETLRGFQERENKLQSEVELAYLKDKDSARQMQSEALRQDDVFSKRFVYYFAILWSLFAILFVFALFFLEVPAENIRMIDTFQGFLFGTIIPGIIFFFYGSSKSSQNKDAVIAKIIEEK